MKKPRWFAKIYNKAIDVFCKEKEEKKPPKKVEIIPTWARKWRGSSRKEAAWHRSEKSNK
jgi:hypothetical protein